MKSETSSFPKLIVIFILAVLLSSCEDYLSVQPSEFLTKDDYYTTLADLQTAVTGAYAIFESDALGGALLTVAPDIMADNAHFVLFGGGYTEISQNQISTSNDIVGNCWLEAYRCVNQLHLILESLEQIPAFPAEEQVRESIRGEALFLRGVIYFELVRLFARPYGPDSGVEPGIPLPERSTTALSGVEYPARAMVQAVYEQVIADLTEAAASLPETLQRGRAGRFAALAYLAKVAFQQSRYEEAAALAAQVIGGPFSLTPEPADFFLNEGSAEDIWSVVHNSQGNATGLLAVFTQARFGGRLRLRDALIREAFPALVTAAQRAALIAAGLEAVDHRLTALTFQLPDGQYLSNKYEDFNGGGDDAPLLRLAEISLLRAEALARTQGVNEESIALLNAVRTRALRVVDAEGRPVQSGEAYIRFSPGSFASAEELTEAIIFERRVELALEGNRFHDLMRLERTVNGLPYDADRLRWPIPQREMDANGNLVQNPGY